MTDDELLVIVGVSEGSSEGCAEGLREGGARVETCVVNANDLATLSAAGVDAVILDVDADPERFVALAAALRQDERTATLPVIARVAPGVAVERVVLLAPSAIATSSSSGAHLLAAVRATRARGDDRAAAAERERDLEDRLRTASGRLDAVGTEARAMAHDARVLCGIVVGYAANLRDEIVGPLEDEQRVHVAQILQATDDLVSLLERFSGAVRATTDAPPSRGGGRSGKPARRVLCNLGELVRGTVGLFDNVAAQKNVAVVLEIDDGLTAWCDPLKCKQVVTNLVVNALKFTPAGGRVTVTLRPQAARPDASGKDARQRVELRVRDTGPGIPAEDRDSVFQRGVRLERDRGLPGSGLGLAVVRDIVAEHKGTAEVEETAEGASLLVLLPTDMRSREGRSLLLVDDAAAAQRIVDAIHKGDGGPAGWRFDARRDSVVDALARCAAVVVVPQGSVPVIDVGPISERPGAPPSSRGAR